MRDHRTPLAEAATARPSRARPRIAAGQRGGGMSVLPARTARFEAFVAPARARPALWRLVAGSALAGAVWLALPPALLLALRRRSGGRAVLLLYLASFAGADPRRRARGAAAASARAREPDRARRLPAARLRARGRPSSRWWRPSRRRSLLLAPPVRQAALADLGRMAAAGASGAPAADARGGAGVPRLPDAGARGALPLAPRLVAAPGGALRRSCTGTRRSSAATPGSPRCRRR